MQRLTPLGVSVRMAVAAILSGRKRSGLDEFAAGDGSVSGRRDGLWAETEVIRFAYLSRVIRACVTVLGGRRKAAKSQAYNHPEGTPDALHGVSYTNSRHSSRETGSLFTAQPGSLSNVILPYCRFTPQTSTGSHPTANYFDKWLMPGQARAWTRSKMTTSCSGSNCLLPYSIRMTRPPKLGPRLTSTE